MPPSDSSAMGSRQSAAARRRSWRCRRTTSSVSGGAGSSAKARAVRAEVVQAAILAAAIALPLEWIDWRCFAENTDGSTVRHSLSSARDGLQLQRAAGFSLVDVNSTDRKSVV